MHRLVCWISWFRRVGASGATRVSSLLGDDIELSRPYVASSLDRSCFSDGVASKSVKKLSLKTCYNFILCTYYDYIFKNCTKNITI